MRTVYFRTGHSLFKVTGLMYTVGHITWQGQWSNYYMWDPLRNFVVRQLFYAPMVSKLTVTVVKVVLVIEFRCSL